MSSNPASAEVSQVSLESLKLRPGTTLQLYQQAQSTPVCEVKLLGVVRGRSVMVGFKGDGGAKNAPVAGKEYVIRGFSGQHDFSFSSQAIQVFTTPVTYAMLAYPGTVGAREVRKMIRTKVSLRATASLHGKNIPHEVTLVDVNVAGAKMATLARIGPPGELVNLAFAVEIDKNKVDMELLSTIRYTTKSDSGGEGYSIGVEFKDLTRDNQLVLHYLASQGHESESSDVVL